MSEHIVLSYQKDRQALADIINECFATAYPLGELVKPTDDPKILTKRVRMLLEDLESQRENVRRINTAYTNLDRTRHGIRNYWWQFWRVP